MQVDLTAVIVKTPEGYAGFVEELPGANTQGATIDEVRDNLVEAASLVLDARRLLLGEELSGEEVVREPLKLDRD